jgi:hypothetical protein
MLRIYLEAKPQPGPYFHMYLVLREAPTETWQINDLAWRNSGEVLRGTVGGLVFGEPLVGQAALLATTLDAYASVADIPNRAILDITDAIGSVDKWTQMKSIVEGINAAQYDYELPITFDPKDHVSNSNAIALTILNAVLI